jgi:haloalkane dehalogenase
METNMSVQKTSSGISFLRTPDERFADLPDFGYEPKYVDIDGLRMAYIDEGPADGTVVLCLHGEPSWSYLYRFMIPVFVQSGFRVIAPDIIGFGRSDKPTERSSYSYAGHTNWMTTFIECLALRDITLFCQDWGGLIGLRIAGQHPDWFARLVIANTALPDAPNIGEGFAMWQKASQAMPFMDCGALLKRAVLSRELSAAEMDAYRAPFPDESYMAGAREFPLLVPTSIDDPALPANQAAWAVLESFTKPVLTLWAPDDVVLGKGQGAFVKRIPGTANQPHQTFTPAGHFLQDDVGAQLAEATVKWMQNQ